MNTQQEWITATQAAAVLGVNPKSVARIAATAPITQKRLPGIPVRYARSEVEALAGRSIVRPKVPA